MSVDGIAGFADAGASASAMKPWRVYKTLLSYFETTCTLLQGMYPAYRACLCLCTARAASMFVWHVLCVSLHCDHVVQGSTRGSRRLALPIWSTRLRAVLTRHC